MEPININLKSTKIQNVTEEEIYEPMDSSKKENMQEHIPETYKKENINLNNEVCLYKWVFVIIMSFTVALGLNSLFMFLIKRLIIQNKMTSFGSISIRTIYPIGILIFLLFVIKLDIIQ